MAHKAVNPQNLSQPNIQFDQMDHPVEKERQIEGRAPPLLILIAESLLIRLKEDSLVISGCGTLTRDLDDIVDRSTSLSPSLNVLFAHFMSLHRSMF